MVLYSSQEIHVAFAYTPLPYLNEDRLIDRRNTRGSPYCEMHTDFSTYSSGYCNGGPQPTSKGGSHPQLDVPSSLVQGHLLETSTLESKLLFLSFNLYFFVGSWSRSVKLGLVKFINI